MEENITEETSKLQSSNFSGSFESSDLREKNSKEKLFTVGRLIIPIMGSFLFALGLMGCYASWRYCKIDGQVLEQRGSATCRDGSSKDIWACPSGHQYIREQKAVFLAEDFDAQAQI